MMKRCVNCGKIVKEEAKFCPNCGHSELIQYNLDETVSLSGKEGEKKKENPQDSREARTEYHKSADYNHGGNANFKDQVKTSGNVDTQKEERQEAVKKKKWSILITVAVVGCLVGAGLAWAMFGPRDSGTDETASSDYVAEQESDADEETISEISGTEEQSSVTETLTTDEAADQFIGTWYLSMDISDAMFEDVEIAEESEELIKYFSENELELRMIYVFEKDDSDYLYEIYIDTNSLLENMKAWCIAGYKSYLEDMLAENGYTVTAEEYMAQEGITEDDLLAGIDWESIAEAYNSSNSSGYYRATDDYIYFSSIEAAGDAAYAVFGQYSFISADELLISDMDNGIDASEQVVLYRLDRTTNATMYYFGPGYFIDSYDVYLTDDEITIYQDDEIITWGYEMRSGSWAALDVGETDYFRMCSLDYSYMEEYGYFDLMVYGCVFPEYAGEWQLVSASGLTIILELSEDGSAEIISFLGPDGGQAYMDLEVDLYCWYFELEGDASLYMHNVEEDNSYGKVIESIDWENHIIYCN